MQFFANILKIHIINVSVKMLGYHVMDVAVGVFFLLILYWLVKIELVRLK